MVEAISQLTFPYPFRLKVDMCRETEEVYLRALPDSDEKNGEARVTIYYFRSSDCCGPRATPCDPVSVTHCGGLDPTSCIQEAVGKCYRRYSRGCAHIDWGSGRVVSPPEAGWESGWEALRRFPLRETHMIEGELERAGEGWRLLWLRMRPIRREDLWIAADPEAKEQKVCADQGEGHFTISAEKEVTGGLDRVFYEDALTRADIAKKLQETPSEFHKVYFRYAHRCFKVTGK
ncbi:MAG: hypothetical protein RMJ66_08045 [Bacteroidia bacterium]|nr:hypothetical protein [Bacteroidia bacterium]